MSELIVIVFDHKYEADEAMLSLLKLEKDYLIDLEDAVVVTKNLQSKIRNPFEITDYWWNAELTMQILS